MSETAQGSRHVTTVFSESLGKDLVSIIVNELRCQPNHWLRMDSEEQGTSLARIREKVRAAVVDCSAIIMGTNFPMVKAQLDSITIKDGVRIALTMHPGDANRHELFEAHGKECLLVMGSAETWLQRMEEVKAMADQPDLFGGDYDPKDDTPGYRRDQSASKPAGKSWAEVMAKLSSGQLTKDQAEQAYGGALPEKDPTVDPLDVKRKDLPVDFDWQGVGMVEYRSLETDEPDSWSDWYGIPSEQLPDLEAEGTMREALAAIHSPITSEFRFQRWEKPTQASQLPAPIIQADDHATVLAADAAELHSALYGIGMIMPLAAVQGLSPEQRQHARDWLVSYVTWATTPKRKKKDMPKRPHFLPLFEPLPPPKADGADEKGSSSPPDGE